MSLGMNASATYQSVKYFEKYVKPWEKTWLDLVPPSIMTENSLNEEQNESSEQSMLNGMRSK